MVELKTLHVKSFIYYSYALMVGVRYIYVYCFEKFSEQSTGLSQLYLSLFYFVKFILTNKHLLNWRAIGKAILLNRKQHN